MTSEEFRTALEHALNQRRENCTFRSTRPLEILDSTHVRIDGQRLINFASNNYLGLTHHPRVVSAFERTAKSFGVGSGAAALVSGHSEIHASAELALARWKGSEAAVILSSGYAANLAAVQMLTAVTALGDRSSGGIRFLIDKLAHASLVDAVRAAMSDGRASFRVFPHNHLGKLRRLLSEADPATLQVVVTESVFSMDGDTADLRGIASLKEEFPFLLLLDEAHGSGVYGMNGAGYAAECGLSHAVDLTVVTLSKVMGCAGGAICASRQFRDAIINFGRACIFSTAIPPAIAAAVEASLGVMRDEPQRQHRLRQLARRVRERLGMGPADSSIIPLILKDEAQALTAAEQLMRRGLLTVAVRPPTVPRGTSRLRLTLSCDHTDDEADRLIEACEALGFRKMTNDEIR